jgi:FtsZ-binding cell division protein ZapB
MTELLRLDKYSPLPWEKKPDGRYWTYITLGEVGHPLTYFSQNLSGNTQKWVEVVTSDGLFNDDSVRSVAGLPIILNHPKSRRYNLNRDGLKVGHLLGDIGKEDGKLIAEAIIDDYRAVEIIDRLLAEGKTPEASSGYLLKELIAREDGTFEQIRGDYDHIAAPLLPGQGRGGQNLTLRFDTGDAVVEPLYFLFNTDTKEEKRNVSDLIVRIDEKDQRILKDVADDVKDVIAALQTRIDTLLGDLEGTEERIEELQTEKDQLQGRIDAADTDTDNSDDIETAVQARFDAWNEVIPVVGSDKLEIDSKLNPSQIKAAAIKQLNPKLNLDGKSEGYIEGLWEGIKDKGQRKTDRFLQTTPRNDSNGDKRSVVVSNYEGAYKRRRRNANS